ncbi:MAG: hypothetical protein BAJALOKI1v1_1230005 [Promethearchaeota archaeon]|nr:MAG: hypothetical protein BAJALOKI1v1_1230005 [Candidatus Lokiarchaeota archaeon]
MKPDELYQKLEAFFPTKLDLMRHLEVGACWQYVISENSIDEGDVKLIYYLYKDTPESLKMSKEKPKIEPDLILYFTEKAIINLIEGNPDAEQYYTLYKQIMNNPQPEKGIELDNKVNKARLKLWKLGYKQWQKDFNF